VTAPDTAPATELRLDAIADRLDEPAEVGPAYALLIERPETKQYGEEGGS
jgi:hypothetical protein